MIFSKYFQKYLGFNSSTELDYNLYFLEFMKGNNLSNLLKKVMKNLL